MSYRLIFLAVVCLSLTTSWGLSEEDPTPLKISKNLYPKKYLPMDLKKYRTAPTEIPESTTTIPNTSTTDTPGSTTENPTTINPEEVQEIQLEDLTTSQEQQFLEAMSRTRKSATTTFCVEIRPSNPYQKPFQVCEPSQPYYGYGPKPQGPRPKPVYYRKPLYGSRPQSQPYHPQPQPHHSQPAPVPQSGYQSPQSAYQSPQAPQNVYQAAQSGYKVPQEAHIEYVPVQPAQSGYQAPQQAQSGYQLVPQQPQSGYQAPQQAQSGYQAPQQAQSGYQQPIYQPQSQESGYVRPVMVLPHVPVAEPYHVAKPSYKPSVPIYRSSNDGWGVEDMMAAEIEDNMADNARSAYYNEEYGGYKGGKTNIYDEHIKKDISYVPIITHSYSKSKPLKFLKVLKDLKKDKFKFDDYERPSYQPYGHQESGYGHQESGYGHQEPEYGHQEYGHQEYGHQEYGHPDYGHQEYGHQDSYGHKEPSYGHAKEGSSSHGLVITCQPSAVGYTGQQNQIELSKHMELLKNIYSKAENLYNQESLNSGQLATGGYQQAGGGYVAPATYRSTGGWKEERKSEERKKGGGYSPVEGEEMVAKSGGWTPAEGERKSGGWSPANERKSGGWSQAEGERKSGGWSQAEGERKSGGWSPAEGERKSGGWSPAEGERKSGGWSQAEGERKSGGWSKAEAEPNMRHSKGGKYNPAQMEEVAMNLQSSAGPSPTAGMMSQKDLDTTTAFRNQQGFA